MAEVANRLAQNGHIAMVGGFAIPEGSQRGAPYRAREVSRGLCIDAEQSRRKPRSQGRLRKARAGEIQGFTGITGDYQPPKGVELQIDTSGAEITASADQIEQMLRLTGILLKRLA